ncbi:hypothetical protein DAPPUDRAFT_222817 [Daphnia pulex]|uniref:CHK kinase-like domain-containing protein n=1 Tax=Daphnia pulex TaxID=6669 RepID=E9G6B7_DAPPU|nr:hypothetical protein DAPPUDRAFT_222817 [Daphnia pulex]|eukprot:EFX85019.1 hypothetical protein DAPPUDRAFT_222817 [Daphnia pulex]
MASSEIPVNAVKEFWKSIFQKTNLTQQLMNLAENSSSSMDFKFELFEYGKVQITAKPAVPLGTNFMSDVFITSAYLANGKHHAAFVKVLPSNPSRLAAGFIGGSYHREYVVYQQWIPELKEIRSSKNLTNSELPLNVAESYFVNFVLSEDGSRLKNETVFVMEELKSKGYRMASTARSAIGIDLNHAQCALRTYANYHALSIANMRRLVKSDGTSNFPLPYEIFRKDPNYISPATVYRTIVLPNYIKVLRHFRQEEVADWLEGLLPELDKIWNWESFMESGALTCLLHGDSWNNNLLFRYLDETSEKPEEMLLIDWQIARCGHPSHDLGYFIFSSTSSSFRKQHIDNLLDEYYAALSSALVKLGIDLESEGYSQKQFIQETKQRYILMMMIALFILPILLDSSKAIDHTLKNDENLHKDLIKELEKDQAKELDEEGTKSGWQSLFEFDTVIGNPLLSQRIVELITDVKDMAWKE